MTPEAGGEGHLSPLPTGPTTRRSLMVKKLYAVERMSDAQLHKALYGQICRAEMLIFQGEHGKELRYAVHRIAELYKEVHKRGEQQQLLLG